MIEWSVKPIMPRGYKLEYNGIYGIDQQSDTWGPRIWGYWLVYGKNDDKPLGLGVPNVQNNP
jgi:hypothetical protein